MSSIQLDGSYTSVRLGGESTGYQGRKSQKTVILFFCVIIKDKCLQ